MSTRLSVVLQPPLDALFPNAGSDFTSQSSTLLGAIRELCSTSAPSRDQVLRGEQISPFVHVFLNGKQIPAGAVASQSVSDGDEICLLTAIRGG